MLCMLQLLLVYIPVHSLGATHSFLASSITIPLGHSHPLTIKTSGSESQGQEEAQACACSDQCDHYSELFTRMVDLNFYNAIAQPLLQLSLGLLQTQYFLLRKTNS